MMKNQNAQMDRIFLPCSHRLLYAKSLLRCALAEAIWCLNLPNIYGCQYQIPRLKISSALAKMEQPKLFLISLL